MLGQNLVPNFPAHGRRRAAKPLTDQQSQRAACGEVKLGEVKMKYAIVEDGGKQYRAVEGGIIEVDYFPSEAGESVDLDRVLLVADGDNVSVGTPFVAGAKVQATVVKQIKGPKIIVFKYKPKKRYRVKSGHRQKYTQLRIESIAVE
jgi:large subunit ribosomal protein L21